MSYVPINLSIYLAAFEGAYSGMTGGGRTLLTTKVVNGVVVPIVSADYLPQATAAGLWAQAYDTVWDDAAAANVVDLENTVLLCLGTWVNASASATKIVDGEVVPTVASDYTTQVTAIITAVLEADAYFASLSPPIVPPVPGGGGGGVTSVTASAPLASSGGDTPNITLPAGGVSGDVLTNVSGVAEWEPPSGGTVLDYAAFYGSSAATPTTAPGVAVAFATAGPTNGVIVGTGSLPTHDFLVPNAGTYDISWQLTDSTGATQTQLATGGTGAYAPIANTTVGRATGTTQMSNRVLVTLAAETIISVINPAGNSNDISQPPPDGSETHINFASLVIRRIA
jgi:hypothetical protein